MAFPSDSISTDGLPTLNWEERNPVPANSRWNETIAAVNGFLAIMQDSGHAERVSLVTYSSKAKDDVKLTDEYGQIHSALLDHSLRFEGGATNIGDGMLEGAKSLGEKESARPWASRVLILLSDGMHNAGTHPIAAASQVANEKIMINTVTFSNEADLAMMAEVADIGSGRHYHADDSEQLAESFREIARTLPTLITF